MNGNCKLCKEAFKLHKNVFTKEGIAETSISGFCESCFDKIFSNDDEENQEEISEAVHEKKETIFDDPF